MQGVSSVFPESIDLAASGVAYYQNADARERAVRKDKAES
jgi:hypothetical protein